MKRLIRNAEEDLTQEELKALKDWGTQGGHFWGDDYMSDQNSLLDSAISKLHDYDYGTVYRGISFNGPITLKEGDTWAPGFKASWSEDISEAIEFARLNKPDNVVFKVNPQKYFKDIMDYMPLEQAEVLSVDSASFTVKSVNFDENNEVYMIELEEA